MFRLPIRLLLTLIVLLIIPLPFFITAQCGMIRANAYMVRQAFYIGQLIWGIKVRVKGAISRKLPLLVVSNHFSYIDVFALGGAASMRFTPKIEIASWPFIGFLSKAARCLFIDRRPHQTLKNKTMLEQEIKKNDIISLFPEGTTNEGVALLPFKSSFFSIAQTQGLMVQPVSIIYEKVNGMPITLENRHLVGWYGDALFFPHVVRFLQQKSVHVKLVFHKPVEGASFKSRKELAEYCQCVVGEAMVFPIT